MRVVRARQLILACGRAAARRGRSRNEQGVVAIIVALLVSMLAVVAGMVIDFGLVRIDRQVDKAAADAAATAGLHALNVGDSKARPFVGVCTAVRYLRANSARFGAVTSTSGTWTTGTGLGVANGCTDTTLRNQVCTPGTPASWARYTWAGTWQGEPLRVEIQSGYLLSATTGWAEDTLTSAKADADDKAQGCDQLSVVITQNRKPGLGSLATSSDMVSSIRSVGRVALGTGGYAPAMLLLKRTGCPVLQSGSASGVSFIHVLGAVSSSGFSQPGTIHSDSDGGGGCSGGSNQNIFLGKGTDGIVAYAAPQVANPTLPDPTKPGQITSVAGANSKPMNYIRDLLANAYNSAALNAAGAAAAAKTEAVGRALVTRQPVDSRYLPGAKTAISQASSLFGSVTPTNAVSLGFIKLVGCKPSQADINGLNLLPTSRLYIDCTTNAGFAGNGSNLSINAETVVFNGSVAPSATISLPNAHHVYINGNGTADSIVLGGSGAKFTMNTTSNLDASNHCATTRSSNKAALYVRDGDIKESNGALLQLCKTTVYMMAGKSDGCTPSYDPLDSAQTAPAPTSTPCSGGLGTGQFTQTGGDIDWTAPDQYDGMMLADGTPDLLKAPAWSDPGGQEDLALWSESGTNSSSTYNMNGGGVFRVRGVYMVPNADPFSIGGGGTMNLANAQFIASSIALNGTTTNITMQVDPNAAVTLPKLNVVGLVR